jgi:hypothetical protein
LRTGFPEFGRAVDRSWNLWGPTPFTTWRLLFFGDELLADYGTRIFGRRLASGLALAVVLNASPSPAQDDGWSVYRDQVFDCRLDYPTSLFTLDPLDIEEDFRRFSGPDGQTHFRVRGADNHDRLTPSEIKAKYLQADLPSDIVYERATSEFLVLSGYQDESIFYTKVAVSPDQRIICILMISYPRGAKQEFDAVVTRMSRSFGIEVIE